MNISKENVLGEIENRKIEAENEKNCDEIGFIYYYVLLWLFKNLLRDLLQAQELRSSE